MSANAPFATAPSPNLPLSRAVIISVLAASLMVGAFAISTQSYWIDEALSLIVAMAPNPSEAWKYAQAVSGSTLQMPLYQIYLYGWHKIFGGGEWAMRASNLPWFFFGQLAFLVLLRHKPRLALLACLLAAINPLIWVYLDETRPYIMQYGAACWFIAALVLLTAPREDSESHEPSATFTIPVIVAMAGAFVILFASSLIGVVWVFGFALALFVAWKIRPFPPPEKSPALWLVGLLTLATLVGFSAYYLFTWQDAGRGYHRSGATLLSLPFLAYEFLGFTGFGPGKLQLRADPVGSVVQSIPALLPLILTIAALAVFAFRQFSKSALKHSTITSWCIALLVPSVLISFAMLLADHRPLPRHFIPALPAVFLALAAVMTQALQQKNILWRAAAVLLPLLWLSSALSYRWQPSHAKDDYRTAAGIAAAALAENKEVWWAADPAAAHIYLTPIALEEVPGRAWAMQAPSWENIRFKFPPRMIVISKPDIYDPQGSIARYAAENRFVPALQLQAFTILVREGDSLPAVAP